MVKYAGGGQDSTQDIIIINISIYSLKEFGKDLAALGKSDSCQNCLSRLARCTSHKEQATVRFRDGDMQSNCSAAIG